MTAFCSANLARGLARRYSTNRADQEDLQQDALLALDRAFRRTPMTTLRDVPAFARTVMQRAMTRSTRRPDPCQDAWGPLDFIAEHIADALAAAPDDQLALEDYFRALEIAHGHDALQIARLLVEPDERVLALVRRRRARRQMPRRAVRQALGFPRARWRTAMRAVEMFTRAWLTTAAR